MFFHFSDYHLVRPVHLKWITTLFIQMDGVDKSMNDIIVWGKDKQEHDRILRQVLENVREVGLKRQKEV